VVSGPWEASLGLLVSRMSLPEEECSWLVLWALGDLAGTAFEAGEQLAAVNGSPKNMFKKLEHLNRCPIFVIHNV
jgi:hypothetical protein